MVDMVPVMEFAARHGLKVIEDAAQAHGARRGGRHAGTVGDAGCFSFYPGKNLGAFGDAGAVVTSDDAVAGRIRLMRDHGRAARNHHTVVGLNSRLDPLHAAVLSVKLPLLERFNERRRAAAAWYRELLPSLLVDPPLEDPEADVHHLLPILVEDRDRVADRLAAAGVETGVHYAEAITCSPAFARCADRCPAAERRAALQLSLPMHPHLRRGDVEYVAGVVADAILADAA
jgi:dTDP-4-amino-4,6-dideoxygalactose transaminase